MEIIGLALMSESSPKQTSQQEKLLQKAKNDYHCIKAICDHLPDGKLRTQVKHMQKIASRLLLYLKSHPDLLPAARRFIDYYQNRVAYILERYVELTQAGLSEDKHQALVIGFFQGNFVTIYSNKGAQISGSVRNWLYSNINHHASYYGCSSYEDY